MRVSEGYFIGKSPILVVAPRMIALYAHTALNCCATTDYTNYKDFSFGVRRYVIFRLVDAKEIRVTSNGDTVIFETGADILEIRTLDALFKTIQKLENEIGICACCGKSIDWIDPIYDDIMNQILIAVPNSNRRELSSYCLDCLALKQIGDDAFCPSTALT